MTRVQLSQDAAERIYSLMCLPDESAEMPPSTWSFTHVTREGLMLRGVALCGRSAYYLSGPRHLVEDLTQ